jgi:signal transduction histidine kinase/ActR/RegA family two-component response regulator
VNWPEIVAGEFHGAIFHALDEMRAKGRCEPFEAAMVKPDGSRVAFMCAGAAFETVPLHGVTWIVDISDRKRSELERERLLVLAERSREEAETANRAKDLFLATVSHELRGPLSPILAWARMLREGQLDVEQSKQAVAVIERSARAQSQIVSDLLDVSRIVAGKLRLRMQPVALASIVENAVESVRLAASAKEIDVHVTLDAPGAIVIGDGDRIHQIVWNLLSNAVKFTPPQGRVDVTLRQAGDHVDVTVTDTGQGIAPEMLPRLFERFWQADASSTRATGGLGLGLSIVRDLSELHGGSVKAESAGPGRGSTFTLTLPRATVLAAEADGHAAAAESASQLAGTRLDELSVLVVDDDPDSSEAIRVLLTQSGAEVRVAASAAHALELLAHWLPDVVVSDIAMPGNDGYMLLAEIRGAPGELARVPAIALTAYGSAEDRARMLAAGFQLHVTKPADPGQLVSAVASLAAGEAP